MPLSVEQRLDLIVEAVRYCQRVRAMGMPASCYAKALREPVHFLWERRVARGKANCAHYRSVAAAALGFGAGELVYDHAVPFRCLQAELLSLQGVTRTSVHHVLETHTAIALITSDESARLNRAGLGKRMPEGWDGLNPLARYIAIGISVVANPGFPAEQPGVGESAT